MVKLQLAQLVDSFDVRGRPGSSSVARANGERILVSLLGYALSDHERPALEKGAAVAPDWIAQGERVKVTDEDGGRSELDEVLAKGDSRKIVECKFLTANSLYQRRAYLRLSPSASPQQLWDTAFDVWSGGHDLWAHAHDAPLEYEDFVANWSYVAKTFMPKADGTRDGADEERILAIWQPIVSQPPEDTGWPPYLSSSCIADREGLHLSGAGRIFSGSLYVRYLLSTGCTELDVPAARTEILDAASMIGRLYR